LDRYEDFLKEWILVGHKSDWKPNVYGKSWIDGGLEPRAVTRDLDWGIDVPVAEPKEKNYMFGLTRLSDIFPLPKNGPREK
jgi:methionyl-tRNA synthetase